MRTINDMLTAVTAIDIADTVEESLYDGTPDIVDQQQQQIKDGFRSDDQRIFNVETSSTQYSPSYAKQKGFKSPIDLYLTGEFNSEIFADVRPDGIVLDSADSKSEDLQKRYGGEIFGLGTPWLQTVIDLNQPLFLNKMIDQLNK